MKVRGYDDYDLWLEWLLSQESGEYVLDWPEHRDTFRNARIRSLFADYPVEQHDELAETVAVVLGLPVEAIRGIVGG